MAHTHHPHLFSHEWAELHPVLLARLKQYGLSLGMGALMASAALLVIDLEQGLNVPLKAAMAVDKAVAAAAFPTATAYFPNQFTEQARQAGVEELPPQF